MILRAGRNLTLFLCCLRGLELGINPWPRFSTNFAFSGSMKTKINNLFGAALSLLAIFGSSITATAQNAGRIAFSAPVTDRKTQQTSSQIFSMNGEGSRVTQLTRHGGTWPAWSRDQKYIAFHRSTPTENTIYVLEVKGGRMFAVVQASGTGHDWSPDDTAILYTGASAAGYGLWLVSVNPATGTVGSPILLKEGAYFAPRFSPDGTKIAFYSGGASGVLDLTTGTEISFGPASGGGQSWSPDCTRIAFGGVVCYADTGLCHSEIVIANADGTGWTPVTAFRTHSDFPVWSPDGQELAFRALFSGGSNVIYKTTIDTGTVSLLFNGGQPGLDWAP